MSATLVVEKAQSWPQFVDTSVHLFEEASTISSEPEAVVFVSKMLCHLIPAAKDLDDPLRVLVCRALHMKLVEVVENYGSHLRVSVTSAVAKSFQLPKVHTVKDKATDSNRKEAGKVKLLSALRRDPWTPVEFYTTRTYDCSPLAFFSTSDLSREVGFSRKVMKGEYRCTACQELGQTQEVLCIMPETYVPGKAACAGCTFHDTVCSFLSDPHQNELREAGSYLEPSRSLGRRAFSGNLDYSTCSELELTQRGLEAYGSIVSYDDTREGQWLAARTLVRNLVAVAVGSYIRDCRDDQLWLSFGWLSRMGITWEQIINADDMLRQADTLRRA
ncbi:uncharacterized protein EV420DRAFT_1486821 [Desarmillaria tabescens]|uniref:Uncharacterized protein n=1 Tax=Armillaria tabescens TaxID=1929756 RepID=A0AA39ML00_ARMTA|nr:uncharacterized protein EV420DRAFT_1486821 [Desarmillaria tabescens]KAK0438167.1 hypothetical protein EV420DRAFT_1486821 [Desarmillaria tabescens]